ncbi:MAG: YqeG family HAD IIIA-type phosphatase [Oscillospiraceae bacterium]|nr:YqeG family HAD IIIA-type phosphatase [Oscillospiraceae bacterium]
MFNLFVPDIIYGSVYDIDFVSLKKRNITGLIFDIDNTLVSYKRDKPDENVINLMNRLKKAGFAVCFVSNNSKQRVDTFNRDFKYFSFSNAKKPLKKSMCRALESMNLTNENVAVIGDQLFTDVAAARRIKAIAVLVNPIEPVDSLFFKFKRMLEKPFIKTYYKRLEKFKRIREWI